MQKDETMFPSFVIRPTKCADVSLSNRNSSAIGDRSVQVGNHWSVGRNQ